MSEKRQKGRDAKESIILLCRILKYSDIYRTLSPDDVRQAKFDKLEVVEILSEVMCSLLRADIASSSNSERSTFVINSLKKLRYPRFSLLCDRSGKLHSSRELLLAVAWYIHIAKVIDHARHEALRPVDITTLLLKDRQRLRDESHHEHNLKGSLSDKINHLTWVVTQLDLLKQDITSVKAGNAKKRSMISSQVKPELSDDPLLLLALRNASLCADYEKSLERKILLLQSCIQWTKLQHVFWLWMDSVLEAAPKLDVTAPGHGVNELQSTPLQSVLYQKLQALEHELMEQRKTYPKSHSEALLSQLQPEQRLEINKEIASMRTRLFSLHHEPCLKPTKGDPTMRGIQNSMPLQQEFERLKVRNDSIAKKLTELRLIASEKLLNASAKFPGIVLLPPEVPHNKMRGNAPGL